MFLFCLVFAMSLCTSVGMSFVVTCSERARLSFVVSNWVCHFPIGTWVRCGTWLYRFLIFAHYLLWVNFDCKTLTVLDSRHFFHYLLLPVSRAIGWLVKLGFADFLLLYYAFKILTLCMLGIFYIYLLLFVYNFFHFFSKKHSYRERL